MPDWLQIVIASAALTGAISFSTWLAVRIMAIREEVKGLLVWQGVVEKRCQEHLAGTMAIAIKIDGLHDRITALAAHAAEQHAAVKQAIGRLEGKMDSVALRRVET